MIADIVISLLTSVGLISLVLFKPSVKVKGHTVSIYWVVALIGALIIVFSGLLSYEEVWSGLTADTAINPVKILVLFISMTMLSVYLDEIGFFGFLANEVLKRAHSSQKRMFVYLYLSVSVLTVFTSNDVIVLTFTPFICYFAKNAKINPVPYLVAEFVAANTWSMALIVGNPTNVYLATAAGIGFLEYSSVMLVPTLVGGTTAFAVLYLIFRKSLAEPLEPVIEDIHIKDKALLGVGLVHLIACIVLLAISSYVGLEMWLITLCFAVSLFIVVEVIKLAHHAQPTELINCVKRAPWELIPFVLSMFIIVLSLSKYGVTERIGAVLGKNAVFGCGITSYLFANLINNIPMSVLFSEVVKALPLGQLSGGIYASIVGSNIGAFLSPIGALAGIMWSGILKKFDVKFTFLDFVKYGAVISVPTLIATLATLLLFV